MQTRVTRNPGTRVTRFFVKPETRVWENPALLADPKPGFLQTRDSRKPETRVWKKGAGFAFPSGLYPQNDSIYFNQRPQQPLDCHVTY